MTPSWLAPITLAIALAAGCSPTSAAPTLSVVQRPATWSVVEPAPKGEWTPSEAAFINDALYLLDESLPPEDARHAQLRTLRYRPKRSAVGDIETWPDGNLGVYSIRTRTIYLAEFADSHVAYLVGTLAHELHHAERDATPNQNRMHAVDRECAAHAREGADMHRLLGLVRERSIGGEDMLRSVERARLAAGANEAQYQLKFELFRLLQALGTLGLHELPEQVREPSARCLELAERPPIESIDEERGMIEELSRVFRAAGLADRLHEELDQARSALQVAEQRIRDVKGAIERREPHERAR